MSERRKRFYKNGIMLAIMGLFTKSVALGFNSFIAKAIGAEGVGLFGLVGMIYSFAITFATSGISLTVTKLTSEKIGEGKRGEISKILRASVSYSLIFSGFATLVLYVFAPYFANTVLSDARAAAPLRVLSFSLIPISVSSALSGYFVGIRCVSKNAFISVFGQIFRVFLTVILLLNTPNISAQKGTYIIALVMTLSEILVLFLSVLQYLFDREKTREGKEKHFQSVTRMALPLAFSAYIRSAFLTMEHALIPKKLRENGLSHTDSLSSYGALHGMALPVLLFPMSPLTSFSGLLVPEFSESLAGGDRKSLEKIASEALNTTLKYAVLIMCIMLLFSEEIGYVIYSSYEAGRFIFILAPVIPLMYLDHVTDAILKGIGEQVYSMWVNISDSLLSIILVIILIPRMGIIGYALVILVMELYNFILSVTRLYSKIKFKINPLKSFILPLAIGVFSSFVTGKIFVATSSNSHPVWLFMEILFAFCIVLLLYGILGLSAKKGRFLS